MQILKHLKSRRLTKKERKEINGMNSATAMSVNSTRHAMTDGTVYRGVNPLYRNMAAAHQMANFVKIKAGVPFVRPALFGV